MGFASQERKQNMKGRIMFVQTHLANGDAPLPQPDWQRETVVKALPVSNLTFQSGG
jgi:hypothetical protein